LALAVLAVVVMALQVVEEFLEQQTQAEAGGLQVEMVGQEL
jgi:hypothetical protein